MEIFDIIVAIAIGFALYSIKDLWYLKRETRRLSLMVGSMPKYRWLLKMGLKEQAEYFNAFGMRSSNIKPNKFGMWY